MLVIDKIRKVNKEQQTEKMAETINSLIDLLPDPNNDKEFSEFLELLQNPPISGETDEELAISFLELSKTNPKFFSQALAFVSLLDDVDTIGNIAKDMAPKTSKVETISRSELDAIQQEDEEKELQKIKDELASIPLDD